MTTDTIKITRRAAFLTQDQVVLPRKLTSKNGAKYCEFFEEIQEVCPCACDDDCENCSGIGYVLLKVPVSWTTIKAIYDKIVESLEVKP